MCYFFEQLLLIVSWIIGWMIFAKPKFLKGQEPLTFPSVSVIIPARNEETNIAKIIRLVKEQTYENLQIIVVNDNSTDKTRDVVLSFKEVELVDLNEEPPKGWVMYSLYFRFISYLAKRVITIFWTPFFILFITVFSFDLFCFIDQSDFFQKSSLEGEKDRCLILL